ncbi:MAG: D-2-hydroxyacid dehydrogenase [Firmicutes bacterium]|nr:D-2-hydroxyacid dehydrogenase [Bacillota bacterium]
MTAGPAVAGQLSDSRIRGEKMRKLVVSIRNMTDEQREAIKATAAELSWTAEIYEDKNEAVIAAGSAEVVFGDTPRFALDAPSLKWICSPSAGVNHFTKSEAFVKSGVMLSNSSGAYGTTISEHILMVTLAMQRRLPEYQDKVRAKEWFRGYTIRSIKGSRVLIMGTGDIGSSAAERFRAFGPSSIVGMNTSGVDESGMFDRMITPARLSDVLPETDIVVMALPLTEKTRHIMNKEKLVLLPDGALIVNVGRGACIDQEALVAELQAGRLRAALDVFEKEPIPEDSELWDCPNLLITPHVSGDMLLPYTVEKIVEQFLEDFRRYAAGERPLRAVELEKGY